MKKVFYFAISAAILSCSDKENKFDATGTFEAVETIAAAESAGIIKEFVIDEGDEVKNGQTVGYIDTIQLSLQKDQLNAQIRAAQSSKPDAAAQLDVYGVQLENAKTEQKRMLNLVAEDAAPKKQLDDANSRVRVLEKQIAALRSDLLIKTTVIDEETKILNVRLAQISDQLSKSKIKSPADGIVLIKYTEAGEMAAIGKPLYKIADLSHVTLKVYVTGKQLPGLKLNQQVKVFVDAAKDEYKEYAGKIIWVSNKAEFTPKTIQTKEERANLVYAVKVRVQNDGYLKIGMYGEVKL